MDYSALFSALEHFISHCESRESRRVFHGRGGCYEGLSWCCVDYFSPILVCSLYSEPPRGFIDALSAFMEPILSDQISGLVIKRRYQRNRIPETLAGAVPDQLYAQREKLKFTLNIDSQNVGFFLDMEPGRQWLDQRVKDKRVLNLFSYSCAFSVVAMAAGAKSVVNIDMSKGMLSRGRENHRINQIATDKVSFLPLNILKSWSRIRKFGPYDIVIIDPPSFQKGSFTAQKDYIKVIRRIPEWLDQQLDILACLNAPELTPEFLVEQFAQALPRARYQTALSPHPDFVDKDLERALKLQHFCLSV